tara:strand:+ start:1719 stop:2744 length:1026 start_codon:yes stop_codon:yes gene_type:complete
MENNKNLSENNISILDFLNIVTRKVKIILITPSILCIMMIIYLLFLSTPKYSSQSKITSSIASSSMTNASSLAAQFGVSIGSTPNQKDWLIPDVIKSNKILEPILQQKFDTFKYGRDKSLIEILNFDKNYPKYGPDTLKILALKKLRNMISVSESIKNRIFQINVSGIEAKFVQEINRSIIQELKLFQKNYNKNQSSETRIFIEQRILETEKELIASEEKLKEFMDRNRRIENSPSLQLKRQQLARESTVLTGVFTTLKQQLETAKIEEVKDSDYVVIINDPNLPIVPISPKKKAMVVMTGIFGLILGFAFALTSNYLESKPNKKMWKQLRNTLLQNLNPF